MKKQMKRTVYEAPVTELFRVELEGNFCGSADVDNPKTQGTTVGEVDNHVVNETFGDYTDNFSSEGWV